MTDKQRTIDDIVIQSFSAAKQLLMDIFETDDIGVIADFSKVLTALRTLNPEAMEKLGRPVIVRVFNEIKCDPTTETGRNRALRFIDNIAFAVNDAVMILNENMQAAERQRALDAQQRSVAQQAISMGRGDLLKG